MSNAIAITSIVASAVVGLSVALMTVRADNRQQHREARAERLGELREILDLGGCSVRRRPLRLRSPQGEYGRGSAQDDWRGLQQ
jgi:hypothetical protein